MCAPTIKLERKSKANRAVFKESALITQEQCAALLAGDYTWLITSLGMVGALSIVRFRTVVKEPLDLVYLFWSITAGIVVGVGLIPLAVIGSVVIGIILFVFVNRKTGDTPYVVVISCTDESAEPKSIGILGEFTKKYVIKAKTVSRDGVELTAEVRLRETSSRFVNALAGIDGVSNATLVSYNGDYYM